MAAGPESGSDGELDLDCGVTPILKASFVLTLVFLFPL